MTPNPALLLMSALALQTLSAVLYTLVSFKALSQRDADMAAGSLVVAMISWLTIVLILAYLSAK